MTNNEYINSQNSIRLLDKEKKRKRIERTNKAKEKVFSKYKYNKYFWSFRLKNNYKGTKYIVVSSRSYKKSIKKFCNTKVRYTSKLYNYRYYSRITKRTWYSYLW